MSIWDGDGERKQKRQHKPNPQRQKEVKVQKVTEHRLEVSKDVDNYITIVTGNELHVRLDRVSHTLRAELLQIVGRIVATGVTIDVRK